MTRGYARRFVNQVMLVVLLGACGSTEPEKKSENERSEGRAVLTEQARVLGSEELDALESVTPDGQYVFGRLLEPVEAGDVLIAGVSPLTPYGALVAVESVTPEGDGALVQTRPAELREAFVELEFIVERKLSTDDARPLDALELRGQPSGDVGISSAFTLPSDPSDEGSLEIEAALSLATDLTFVFSLNLADFNVGIVFEASEAFEATVTGEGTATINASLELGSYGFTPVVITLPGGIPLVITPRVAFVAGATGGIQGEVQASVVQEAGFRAHAGIFDGEFDAGFDPTGTPPHFEPPTYGADVNLKAYAGPRFEVLLYALGGIFAQATAFVELSASAEGPPLCARGVLNAGFGATVGLDLVIYETETTLFNHVEELASFDSCTDDPEAPRPAVTWARSFGREGSPGERARAVLELSDGTYLVVGDSDLFQDITGYAASVWALRVDALGNVMWQRAFSRISELGLVQAVAEAPGRLLVAGTSGVIALDPGGNPVWAMGYTADDPFEINAMHALADGGFVVAGWYGTEPRAWAMQLDAKGKVVWSAQYASGGFARVRATSDGAYVLAGQTDADMYLAKLDEKGSVLWERAYENRYDPSDGMAMPPTIVSSIDRGFDVGELPGGGFVVVGETYGAFPTPVPNPVGYFAAWAVRTDADGELRENTVYRAPDSALYDSAYAVGVRPDGSALILGRRADGAEDQLTNEDLLLIQGGAYAVLGSDGLNDAVAADPLPGMPLGLTRDGGAIVLGTTNSFFGQEQFWLVKLNRTAGINFPYRESLSGSTYVNDNALSLGLMSNAVSTPITARSFVSEVTSEVTPPVVLRQTP